jgi:cyclophilin family peptidyl-prolyl cis-trans isomerase
MGSEKRERQKDNRRSRLEAEAQAWKKQQRNRRLVVFLIAGLILGLVVLITNVFGEDDEADEADEAASTSTTGEPTECPAEDGSSPQTLTFSGPPPMCIDPAVQYDAIVTTDVGEITIELDGTAAPTTVNNFVVLSRYHFYDDVPFHRVIPGFMVQGGDANGEPAGTGDPGYAIPDELPGSVDDYVRGSVAMANSGPNTGGSQFFIWMGPQALPAPDYALFGQVTDGLDVVEQIEADGNSDPAANGVPPTVEHRIISIEIVERGADSTATTGAPDSTATTGAPDSTATTGAPDSTATTSEATIPDETTTAPTG